MSAAENRPFLRIVRGDPTPEEVAALVAVLAAAAAPAEPEVPAPRPVTQWATPARLLREPVSLTGWWASSLPR